MEITLQLRFVFVRHFEVFFLRHNYVIYLFDLVNVFYDVRITFYFGTFELRIEKTLQLRFDFARHCDVFFITSQLRYLFLRLELRYILVRSNYVRKLRLKMVIF